MRAGVRVLAAHDQPQPGRPAREVLRAEHAGELGDVGAVTGLVAGSDRRGPRDCDYDDADARVALVAALATDGRALLAVLHGRELDEGVEQAGVLLATVLGQDLDQDAEGVFRIARRVAEDRVISTVDPQARHGHKTAARGFDGYKGHVGIDPDSEIISATTVSPGNAGDASVAEELIPDLLLGERTGGTGGTGTETTAESDPDQAMAMAGTAVPVTRPSTATTPTAPGSSMTGWGGPGSSPSARPSSRSRPADCSPRTASASTWNTTP